MKTRRIDLVDFKKWANKQNNSAFTVDLQDKFGKMGIIALLGYEVKNNELFIEDFVLSCRASGRKIEDCILAFIKTKATELGCNHVFFYAKKTQKNKPMIDFLDSQKCLNYQEENLYIMDPSKLKLNYPEFINVNFDEKNSI